MAKKMYKKKCMGCKKIKKEVFKRRRRKQKGGSGFDKQHMKILNQAVERKRQKNLKSWKKYLEKNI